MGDMTDDLTPRQYAEQHGFLNFFAPYQLTDEERDELRLILVRSAAPGEFAYELAQEDGKVYGDGDYWDIVYRLGDQRLVFDAERDDEVWWSFEDEPQALIDTLIEVFEHFQALPNQSIELLGDIES
jgi:hypothetical protein